MINPNYTTARLASQTADMPAKGMFAFVIAISINHAVYADRVEQSWGVNVQHKEFWFR